MSDVRGTLTILESETGSGKSEAAFSYFLKLRKEGKVDGLYFALPTRTSAVQIHKRLESAVSRAFKNPPPVVLAVPGYIQAAPCINRLENNSIHDDPPENWHAEIPKKYLAATVAVGTVDQVLLSILKTKHASLRWAAFGRSLLVIDEVHSSDTYMCALIETVIRKHIRRGGHILLMSATLGDAMRRRFIELCCEDGNKDRSLQDCIASPYPLITKVDESGVIKTKHDPYTGLQKEVHFDLHPIIDDADAIADLAVSHAEKGAKILVVRNSVAGCVDVHKSIEEKAPHLLMQVGPMKVTSPHHGRYTAEDRVILDIAVEDNFGKGSVNKGVILCATQTVEQSIDIDADLLITDLCPIDVLLQRCGRLHRHFNRGKTPDSRPHGYQSAKTMVLTPNHPIEMLSDRPAHGLGFNRAYPNLVFLKRTKEILETKTKCHIPSDNRFLIETATHDEGVALTLENAPKLANYMDRLAGETLSAEYMASANRRDEEWLYGDKPDTSNELSKRISSRLGAEDLTVSLMGNKDSALGNPISKIKIPSWFIGSSVFPVDLKENGCEVHINDDFSFGFSGRVFSYSRYGLEILRDRGKPS